MSRLCKNVQPEWQRREEMNKLLSCICMFGLRKVIQSWDICWLVSGILHNVVSAVLVKQCWIMDENAEFWRRVTWFLKKKKSVEKCETPFGDVALGEQCSRMLGSTYTGVTVVWDSCVGLQTVTAEGRKWRISDKIIFALLALLFHVNIMLYSKAKATPLQAWTGPEGSRRLRLPDFKTVDTWRR